MGKATSKRIVFVTWKRIKRTACLKFLDKKTRQSVGKILLTFVLVTFVGGIITHFFNSSTWNRQARYEILKGEIEDDRRTVSEVTSVIEERFFAAQRIVWEADNNGPEQFEDLWKTYMEAVHRWNMNDQLLQRKIATMAGWEQASKFLTKVNDLDNEVPLSIHYKFYRLHERLVLLRECYYEDCSDKSHLIESSQNLVDRLIEQQTIFLDELSDQLTEKYNAFKKEPSLFIES